MYHAAIAGTLPAICRRLPGEDKDEEAQQPVRDSPRIA
jgi:hypothetical protein